MAIKGNLRDFTITQLLNLINLAKKTGTLIVEGPNDRAYISFREGKLAFSQMGNHDNSLAAILYRSKKITRNQYEKIRKNTANMNDKELGILLMNANYMSQQDILETIQKEFTTILNRLFTWVEGPFRFENGVLPPDGKITLKISLENIIIAGARKLQEMEQLEDEIPSLEIALKFVSRPGTNIKNVRLSKEEWRVVSYINPKNTLRKIAQTTKKSDHEIRKIAYGLLQAGLVELVRAETPQAPVPVRPLTTLPPKEKEQHKSLINRLIKRIRSL